MLRYMREWEDGRFKLAAIATILDLRRNTPSLFANGSYEPLIAEGPRGEEVCAFLRSHESKAIVTAVARFPARREAEGVSADTVVPLPETELTNRWRDALTGRLVVPDNKGVSARALFAALPVAVLVPLHPSICLL